MATTPPKIELVLTSTATEPGAAAMVRNGRPVYTVDGQELELDYAALRSSLHDANEEARTRREALEAAAKHLGLTGVDIRNADGLTALLKRLEGHQAESAELAELRTLKAAGALDDKAEDKIKKAAGALRQDEINRLAAELETLRTSHTTEKQRAEAALKDLASTRTVTGLRAFYDQASDLFADHALETFLIVAQQQTADGYRWRPTGESNSSGIPQLALMDDAGNVRKGPDGLAPMSPKSWAEQQLRTSHPTLFRPIQGGPAGNPGGAPTQTKAYADMTQAEIADVARRTYAS